TMAPIDRVEREGHDVARAQAIGGDEEEHGVVAQAVTGAAIDLLEQSPDGRPRQTAWQLFLTIHTRGVDLTVQARRHFPAGREKTEKAPESSDRMLKGGATQTFALPSDEGLHFGSREGGQSLGLDLVIEVCEELLGRGDVLPDGERRQTPEVIEGGAVDLCQHLDPRDGRWRRREQGALLKEAEEPTDGSGRTWIPPMIPPPAHVEIGLLTASPSPMPGAPETTAAPHQSPRLLTPRAPPIPLPR